MTGKDDIREDEVTGTEEARESTGAGDSRLGRIMRTVGRGEILFTLKCDKFFPHILYAFFLIFLVLVLNLMIEKTLVEMEENRKVLYDMKVALTHKNTELIGLEKLSSVQELLEKAGSDLTIPDGPAIVIKD